MLISLGLKIVFIWGRSLRLCDVKMDIALYKNKCKLAEVRVSRMCFTLILCFEGLIYINEFRLHSLRFRVFYDR